MKKRFVVKDITGKVVAKISADDIASAWDEGVDSTLEDLADRLFPDDDDNWDKVTEVVEDDDDDLYNEWFSKGYFDDAALATLLDRIAMGDPDFSYNKDTLPLSIYRNGRRIHDIDQQLIDDIGSYGD